MIRLRMIIILHWSLLQSDHVSGVGRSLTLLFEMIRLYCRATLEYHKEIGNQYSLEPSSILILPSELPLRPTSSETMQ